MVWFSVSIARGAGAACPATVTSLGATAERGIDAYERIDLPVLHAEAANIRREAGCLAGPISPAVAARAHLVVAIDAFTLNDRGGAVASLRGALAADPALSLDVGLVPVGNDLHELLAEARKAGPGDGETATGGLLFTVDGHEDQARLPTERSSLVQGSQAQSWYLNQGRWPDELTLLMTPTPSRHTSRNLLFAGGAVAIASGASLLVAADARADFDALGPPSAGRFDEAELLFRRNRAAALTGYGLAVVSCGLLAGAAFTVNW